MHWDRVLADTTFDGEHNHGLCRERPGIRSTVIPVNRRTGRQQRLVLLTHWCILGVPSPAMHRRLAQVLLGVKPTYHMCPKKTLRFRG